MTRQNMTLKDLRGAALAVPSYESPATQTSFDDVSPTALSVAVW